jgi:hypothetical protein
MTEDTSRTITVDFNANRAVSDVLAFTIVFAIIITSVAIVYSVGFSSISELQGEEQNRNAGRAFEALGKNFDGIERGKAQERAGSLSLRGGSLVVQEDATVNVSVFSGGGLAETTGATTMGSLQYTSGKTELAYQGGGVFRSDAGSSVVVEAPRMTCEADRAVVTVVRVVSSENGIQADGVVSIGAARAGGPNLVFPNSTYSAQAERVTVNLSDTRHGEAWERHLVEDGNWQGSGGDYACDFGGSTGTVYVRVVTLRVTFSS